MHFLSFILFYFYCFRYFILSCSSPMFCPIINLQQRTKPQTQISTKRQTHISSNANLSLQIHKFSWQTNTEKPTGKTNKSPSITTTKSKNMNIKSKQKNRNPTSSKAPPSNQIFQNFPATSKALTSNLLKS